MLDFGQIPPVPTSSNHIPPSPSTAIRPTSTITTRSENNRESKYATSIISPESQPHLSHLSHYYHNRQGNQDDFIFLRPDNDEDIEALFNNVKRTRDLGEMPGLSTDQKWHMVYSDEHIRWKEERTRDEQSKKQTELGQPATIVDGTPEWYIKKFLDKTITPKQAGSLLISLRSREMRCSNQCRFSSAN
jgi:cytokinesis protein